MSKKGTLIILSAPSGAGKSTLISLLKRDFPHLEFSISYTTRKPRPGEVNGRDYFFVSKEDFEQLKEKNFFAEWAKVHNHYYGTPKEQVLKNLEQGKDIIFDIDVQGAKQIKANLNQGLFIFIFPPSLSELKKRLEKRGADDEETIKLRLKNASLEIKEAKFFDYWIVNDKLERAYSELKSILIAEKLKPVYRPNLIEEVLKNE